MKLLNEIVKQMLKEHTGGEKFFDHLDKNIQKPIIIENLFEKAKPYLLDSTKIIVSGKFGIFFYNWYCNRYRNNNKYYLNDIVIVDGELRNSRSIDLSYIKDFIFNYHFIFFDDSYYSGTTKNTIARELKKYNSKIVKTFVIYDGSLVKDNNIHSLCRYYDTYKKCELKEK